MAFVPFKEINASDSTGTQFHVKQEPESESLGNLIIEPVPSMARDGSFERVKNELVSDEEIIGRPRKKRKKNHRIKESGITNALRNGGIEVEKTRRPDLTQLPCIVNIKPSAVLGRPSQDNNGTMNTSNGICNTSLQSSISERICESNEHVALNKAVGQNSSNNDFASKVYEMLVDIQSTLKDLKEVVAENSKRIDQLQGIVPKPCPWTSTKSEFNFPISTEEELLEFEKQLENIEKSAKLVAHLTSRTYTSWREMVLVCLKYMMSRNVAILYNLNGKKGTKKKFRDLKICNTLVDSVHYKFKEVTTEEILRRISFILAGARDWQGLRHKKD
ncbi:unnamed protein product [Larinioides sclopetarius]|uniref:DUF4806 domain-containing protein n=2 Tax=Larinioides sclopetarius TaxID=280406 RepID=A0AAV2AVI0_9ARAC